MYNTKTGLPKNQEYLTKNLPTFLQHDISAYIEGEKNNSSLLDCLWCELNASINIAENEESITPTQADYLRKKHLFGERE